MSALQRRAQSNKDAPRTPRPSLSIHHSPASSPSISSSIPFDWEAARARRPPPYSTPQKRSSRQSVPGTPRKSIIKKKSLAQKISSLPSQIAFEIAIFPNNVPLPTPKTSAYLIGGLMHILNLFVRVAQADPSEPTWAELQQREMHGEYDGHPWFDWTTPISFLLFLAPFLNAFYLFTRIKVYRLARQADPVSSPNAKFVPRDFDLDVPSLTSRLSHGAWFLFVEFWRFLLGLKPSTSSSQIRVDRIQQLEIWAPGDIELNLFCVYSPVHPLIWRGTNSSNWILMFFIMGIVGLQMNVTILSYKALLKDKDIISAEVMHEYNEGFVYRRLNPIRKDVATMTHQSEVVNVWED